jgi:hypothetical protein
MMNKRCRYGQRHKRNTNSGNLVGNGAMGSIAAEASNLEGMHDQPLTFRNCINAGNVTSTVQARDGYDYQTSVGGILGIASDGPVQEASSTSDKTPAEPGKTTAPALKGATFYEVVRESIQNNPIIVRALLLFVVALAGLGGFRRYRKSRLDQ